MRTSRPIRRSKSLYLTPKLAIAILFAISTAAFAHAQDLTPGLTYICNGEHIFIENCNTRDLSDAAKCMVGHPDHVNPNGLMQYTYVSRGDLKKLFPTCTQPSAKQTAAAHAFQQKQQDTYNANAQKANDQLNAATAPPAAFGQPKKPKTPEERATNRCITSGRLPSSCLGNSLLGGFGQMLAAVLPSTPAQSPSSSPTMAGVFQGAGNWRLDFIDGGVLVNCSFLSPNQQSYKLDFRSDRTVLEIDTTPKPLVLTLHTDGTITGPGPVTIDGVVASGTSGGNNEYLSSGYHDKHGVSLTNNQISNGSEAYDALGNRVYSPTKSGSGGYTTFAHRRATCPALNLSSKGAGVGIQTMQTDLLKTAFGGDKGPPTPPGIRMHGIFAASTGFSVEFFPESAILGCGPDAARAYPYMVAASGSKAVIKIEAPDRPLSLVFGSDGSLAPAETGPYQVHGRTVTGQNNDDDFTFAPYEQTCNLAVFAPSKQIPSSGGTSTTIIASSTTSGASASNSGGSISTPTAPLGTATLSIVSGLPGNPNPLAGRPYVLLRDSYAVALAKGGVSVPPGTSPYKYAAAACANKSPDCQKITEAIKASAASAVRADANGSGIFPGVPPGNYYLMISTRYNNQPLIWGQAVQIKPGTNSVTLDQSNATPGN